MAHFTFDIDNPSQHFIRITATFDVSNDNSTIQLPSWRPGRYELGNFAKNVRNLNVYDENNHKLKVSKITKDSWSVDTLNCKSIKVEYLYYSNELNAGSTFLDDSQLYVNPVNCCIFEKEAYSSPVSITLNIPSEWNVATSMVKNGSDWAVDNFDEFFDSPFIASGNLQHESYKSSETIFHVWFNGEVKPEWERLINDFKAFTDKQIEKFREFPVDEYHFLIQILPIKAYHGVEHQKSTVISLGPSYDVFKNLYKELLGVSSHELYHTWNVKAIRPIEMFPYDFTKENYSRLGYLCEGVTTYQGDLFLLKSGVFNEEQYFNELSSQMQKHFDNHGRFNYSVAESSFDTWLDGYVPGIPGRKVSIYTEGCLLAFVTDVKIRKSTNNKYGLDEVMKRLFFDFALKNMGVSEEDYQRTIENVSGESFDDFFRDYINGNNPYESILTESLAYLGLELNHSPSKKYSEGRLGMKLSSQGDATKIIALYPGGPAETAGLSIGDVIISINSYAVSQDVDKWCEYFDEDVKTIGFVRNGINLSLSLPEVNRNFYMVYSVEKSKSPNNFQKSAFDAWKK